MKILKLLILLALSTLVIVGGITCFNKVKSKLKTELCLVANERDPESITGSHLTVRVIEETSDYYVTGSAWDHLNHEWVDMDYKVVDKPRAPGFVTAMECPK